MSNGEVVLAARVRAELAELAEVVQRAERMMAKVDAMQDEDYLDGVALNLHGFYAGVERILEAIAREIDDTVPRGVDWHRNLLLQMSVAVENLRPAAISTETRSLLDDYRGFRHVVRNVYTFNLRPTRLRELVANLPVCHSASVGDIQAFCTFLEQANGVDHS